MVWLIPAFAILAGAGAFMLWLPGASLIITFAGLFTVLIACSLLVPGLTAFLMRGLTPLSSRVLGTIGRLAPRDIVRSLSRTSVAIAALMIAVSVIVGVSIMIGSFRQTVAQWLANTLQADIYLSPPTLTANRIVGALPPEVVEAALQWPDVTRAVTAWRSEVLAPELGRPIELVAVSGDVSDGHRNYAWIDGDKDDLWQRLADGEGVLLSEPLVLREGLGNPPGPLTLQTAEGPHAFPVLAVFYDYSSDQGSVLIGRQAYERWWGNAPVSTVGLFLAETGDSEEVADAMRQQFGGRQDVVVQSNSAVRSNALDIFDRTFAITAALQLLAIAVAFIGVLSALLSLQLERIREFGVLRAVGMTVRELWRLTLLETGLIGLTAGLFAMPVGWVLAWILVYVINRRSFGWTLEMNLEPSYFLQALAVAVGAALLAGLYPSFHIGRLVVATAVREE
jgi:putative ABC transport system permease protein